MTMLILINSSKTMVSRPGSPLRQTPIFRDRAKQLMARLDQLDQAELRALMHLSPKLAVSTEALIDAWSTRPAKQTLAIDAFQGDIYRGLAADTLSGSDRDYANEVLRILSGLYGMLRPYDGIMPYRLELEYRLGGERAGEAFQNLYQFWGDAIANKLPRKGWIVNLASQEYFRVIDPSIDAARIIEPQFLSVMKPGDAPTFVAVHAKVARGAYARWLIQTRLTDPERFCAFDELGYRFDEETSTLEKPVFVKQV
jgi:cytoplasmic iron level regulating protein YaaA (DUF328/UPF0246 family)